MEKKPPDKLPEKEKAKRPDVAKRIAENKNKKCIIVKTTLNSFIASENIKNLIQKPLGHILKDTNKAVFEAYNLANLHAVRMLDLGKSITPNQDFYYKCLSAVSHSYTSSNHSIKDDIEGFIDSFNLYKTTRSKEYTIPDSSYISSGVYQDLSLQMATNATNFISMRFYKIFKNYLQYKYCLTGEQAYDLLYNIQSEEYIGGNIIVHFYRCKMVKSCKQLNIPVKENNVLQFVTFKNFRTYLQIRYCLTCDQASNIIRLIQLEKYDGRNIIVQLYRDKLKDKINLISEKAQSKKCKNCIPGKKGVRQAVKCEEHAKAEEDGKKSLTTLFRKAYTVLPILRDILSYNEAIHEIAMNKKTIDKKVRLFTLLPTKIGFTTSHIKLCSTGLFGLIKHIENVYPKEIKELLRVIGIDNITREAVKDKETAVWNMFFKTKKFKSFEFGREIQIDGKAVSILYKRPKTAKDRELEETEEKPSISDYNLNPSDFDIVWGLDPGRTSTFVSSNLQGETVSVSTKSYYHDAKFKESNKIIKGWQDRNPEVASINLRMPTSKSANIDTLLTYNSFALQNVDTLLDFYMQKPFRDMRFKRYVFSHKTLRNMCKLLVPKNKKVLVGFGDWSAQDSGIIKSCPAGPVKKFEHMLKEYATVVAVDEYKTSKLHRACHCVLKNHRSNVLDKETGKEKRQQLHSVLYCSNNSCNGITMNRDNNASKNILDLLVYEIQNKSRHPAFLRDKKKE